MPFSYANPTSGPSAGGIGWFTFGDLTITPGTTLTGLSGTLNNGATVTFDLNLTFVSGQPRTFVAVPVPVFSGSYFGNLGYTEITGNAALYSDFNLTGSGVNTFTISNIVVEDSGGSPISNYTVVLADAETSNTAEVWQWQTNGGVWNLLVTLGDNPPILTGLGTQLLTITGNQLFPQATQAANIATTLSPTQLMIASTETQSGRQAFSIGFALTQLSLQKNIGHRIDPTDQFVLDILGIPASQTTTTGSANGIQAEFSSVYAVPGTSYTINESMAPGSSSALADYSQIISSANATPAGSVPPVGSLPISFTPAIGDDVTYTILNAAPQIFKKSVDKAFADVGEVLTYTLTVDNPNDFTVSNILVTDATPAGTQYIGNLSVSAPFTGADPASGLTITTIGPDSSVTITYQILTNIVPPMPNPIPNYANVTVPGGTSGMTNVVTTQVNTAYVTIIKTVDKVFASPGDILTYTLVLNNAGNVPANNVSITDAVPAGTVYVPGSLTGAVGTPPVLTLKNPIGAGGSSVVTFQVKVSAIPATNPIPNRAAIAYVYTIDPANPNGGNGGGTSNEVVTQINIATLSVLKSADKNIAYPGDIVTYQFAVTNSGNIAAEHVVLTDVLPNGLVYVPGSLTATTPVTGAPPTIQITAPIDAGKTVNIFFRAKIAAMPNPNPAINKGTITYNYPVDPNKPNVPGTSISNHVCTRIFRNNYLQQITDIIESSAMEEAALSALINAEGAKIQKMAATNHISAQDLMCINKSLKSTMDSISLLETIIRQKIAVIDCQINHSCM